MLFQFKLGKIPVQVHFSHLLIAGVFGYMFAQGGFAPDKWPGNVMGEAGEGNNRVLAAVLMAWVAIIFVSVLVHELGHALVSLAFGYSPVIQLAGMGGNTRPNAKGPIAWWRDILLTIAGPAFGASLGLACLVGYLLMSNRTGPAAFVLESAAGANFFWAVVNLLPVTPLDGGRISMALLMRIFGRPGFLIAQVLALVVSGAVAASIALYWKGGIYIALMFGWYGISAIQLISAYLRGDAPGGGQAQDPHAAALAQATALYREGKLDATLRLAEATLAADVSPPMRSRLHHLLGWVALKEGKGREALDHFAQVQGQRVEPQALAAGFSLVGDDARALTLWEHGYRESGDRTILHEWAGTLIRLGREEEARRLAGVDITAAFACAERVLFIRGDFLGAAKMGVAALESKPTAERAYDTACAFARAGKLDDALRLLARAQELGFADAAYAAADEDLAHLRERPEFDSWLAGLGTRRAVTKP